MSSLSISPEEKSSIDSILEAVENEILGPPSPYKNLSEIDKDCKALWPSWYAPDLSLQAPAFSKYRQSFTSSTQLDSKSIFNSLSTGSNATPQEVRKDVKPRVSTAESPSLRLAEEVDAIKEELTELMNKLKTHVHTTDVPELIDANPFDVHGDMEEDYEFDKQNEPVIVRPSYRSKAKMRAKVIKRQREIIAQKAENTKLEADLLALKMEFVKSQKNIIRLKEENKKSDIILKELKKQEIEKHDLGEFFERFSDN